uniref:RNA-directed DNA polymerase, eukaryota n=1 Tax=Tanacetum cinerariifolium TaxID=118510 RepID=A0A6L2LBW0_TANCI|nr:RNA-directed DNA polymerase, eukaryota [Tanacetum cinerariifolium]
MEQIFVLFVVGGINDNQSDEEIIEANRRIRAFNAIKLACEATVRGGIEQHTSEELTSTLETVSLSNSSDRWICDLTSDGEFRVKEVRNCIDDIFLPSQVIDTRWVRFVPIKHGGIYEGLGTASFFREFFPDVPRRIRAFNAIKLACEATDGNEYRNPILCCHMRSSTITSNPDTFCRGYQNFRIPSRCYGPAILLMSEYLTRCLVTSGRRM